MKVRQGFTIVELLIVVVVIAILAAITIVSYNGITNQANDSSVKSNLSDIVKKAQATAVTDGDNLAYCRGVGGIDTVDCLNDSDAFKAVNGSAYKESTTDALKYEPGLNGDIILAGLSKSGHAFKFQDGKIEEITLEDYGYIGSCVWSEWSSSTKVWVEAAEDC